MGNEAGEWIIHGVTWDDPKCIHDVDEAVEYINRVGFLPLFKNEIPGFSLEAWKIQAYGFIEKPYTKQDIMKMVERYRRESENGVDGSF